MPTITPFGASDHDVLSYTRFSRLCPTNCPTIRGRTYKYFRVEKFLEDLRHLDWSDVLTCFDINQAVQIFTQKLNSIYDQHAPWIVYQKQKNYAPWITHDMKNLMSERDE